MRPRGRLRKTSGGGDVDLLDVSFALRRRGDNLNSLTSDSRYFIESIFAGHDRCFEEMTVCKPLITMV